jgi:hypothetical protein
MMVKMKTTLGMEILLSKCSYKYNMYNNHCFSYDLIQLRFYWRGVSAFCFPTDL